MTIQVRHNRLDHLEWRSSHPLESMGGYEMPIFHRLYGKQHSHDTASE